MDIRLSDRTPETVTIYFEKTNHPEIKSVLPQKASTVEEALDDYEKTLLPDAKSYGRIILVDGKYIGDIWCYCIDMEEEPNTMISYCIFEKDYRSKGIATKAVALFIAEIQKRYLFKSIGAFTFSKNMASIRVLQKNDFIVVEEFEEGGILSKYLQRNL